MEFDLSGKAIKHLRLPTVDYYGSSIKIIPAQAGDANSRCFCISLYDDTGDLLLSNYSDVELRVTTPDGNHISSAGTIDKPHNVAMCQLTRDMLLKSGKLSCDVRLSGTDKNNSSISLTSQTFFVMAYKSQDEVEGKTSLAMLIDGTITEVTPDMLQGVSEIGQYAFAYQNNLGKVVLPDNVAILHNGAFSYCENLKSVMLPPNIRVSEEEEVWDLFYNCQVEHVTAPVNMLQWFTSTDNLKTLIINGGETIDDYSFSSRQTLTSVTIGDSITSVGSDSFTQCGNLSSIKIGKNVESIGSNTFTRNTNLTSIEVDNENTHYHVANGCLINSATKTIIACTKTATIPTDGSVTTIRSNVFKGRTDLTTIPEGITTIGSNAFSGCTGLTSIPSSVTTIGSTAFSGCKGLTSVTIPAAMTSIEANTFANCSGLTSVSRAEGSQLTQILAMAFSRCTGLSNIDFLDGVKSISTSAFEHCTGITSIIIPSSVESIQYGVFSGCTNVETITVDEANATYHSAGNCLINTSAKQLIAGCKNSVIPDDGSVTVINQNAFYYCADLVAIVIPAKITTIGGNAFAFCGLTSIDVPSNTKIAGSAFQYCKSLSSIIIRGENSITGTHAFNSCAALATVSFISQPNITHYCFGDCSAVTKYDFRGATSVPTLPSTASLGHAAGCQIIVPDNLYNSWKSRTNWSALTNVVWVKASEYTEE